MCSNFYQNMIIYVVVQYKKYLRKGVYIPTFVCLWTFKKMIRFQMSVESFKAFLKRMISVPIKWLILSMIILHQ